VILFNLFQALTPKALSFSAIFLAHSHILLHMSFRVLKNLQMKSHTFLAQLLSSFFTLFQALDNTFFKALNGQQIKSQTFSASLFNHSHIFLHPFFILFQTLDNKFFKALNGLQTKSHTFFTKDQSHSQPSFTLS